MSRFLHNIIATARSPARSVRPVVPSIHEDAPTETPPLALDPAASPGLVASQDLREFAEPSRKATFEVNVPLVATAQPGHHNTTRDEPAEIERPFQPIPLLTNASDPESRNRTDPPARTPDPGVLLHEEFDNTSEPPALEPAARTTTGHYSPLVLERSAPRSTPQALPAPPTRSAGQTQSNRGLARQQRPPPHDTDEIQIHIGRIEVTAVPPPPVKAAPAPTRKSPSLDEYLKRRPGRAR
jgi:hypothetical protein